ncbi:MAG: DUF3089 domain-containing protein [Desulfobacter sp.]|nr:DUF3089 domain-containing protein [Desulfobacter sp.]
MGFLIFSCSAFAGTPPKNDSPDYAGQSAWIFLPQIMDKPVDLFFMHPTTYFDTTDGYNVSLANKEVSAASKAVASHQSGFFADHCNIFAPYYRQASMAVLEKPEQERDAYLKLGLKDYKAAFAYYLKYYNQGRILAGHSQGSNLTLWAMKEGAIPLENVIAAYIIGWSVTRTDLDALDMPLAVKPDQTGCIISWNTIGDKAKSPVIVKGALVVNPLT